MTRESIFGIAASAVVLLGVGLAFSVIGTPSHARLVALDQRRVGDLKVLESRVQARYGAKNAHLPRQLPSDFASRDPVTHRAYAYRRIDATQFVLCAQFALAEKQTAPDAPGWPHYDWSHGVGLKCFKLDVSLGLR